VFEGVPDTNEEEGMNILIMAKGGEHYMFFYDDDSTKALEQTFKRFAENPDLKFSWADGATLSQIVREKSFHCLGGRRMM
jgi:hypothetical protein